MSHLIALSLAQVLDGLKTRMFTAQELTQAYLDRMDQTAGLNAYITFTRDLALAQAAESDRKWAAGTAGPLEGIPLAIKDAYCTQGVKTTAASRMLGNFVPTYESTVSQKLQDAGAVMLGKANLDEFCMGSATTPVFTGTTRNPWDAARTAGGSSGGTAAAVAAGAALAGVGTDTGGSVRQPAAFCGLVGIKPTYGLCSRWGVVAFASSLDCPGPMTRTVQDAAILLQAMAGHDPKDSTSLKVDVPNYCTALGQTLKGKRVGIPQEWYAQAQLDSAILQAWDDAQEVYRQAGCEVVPVSLPYSQYSLPCYYILACAEAASNLLRYDGVKYGFRADDVHTLEDVYEKTRGQGFGPEVKRRILTGIYVLSQGYYEAYYGKAQKVRAIIEKDFRKVFQTVDVLLTPTTPTTAFSLDPMPNDPLVMYWNDILTVPVNIGNGCAMSVPTGVDAQGLPIGMQLVAPALGEERLFAFGSVLEQASRLPCLPLSSTFSA